jgi:hypothetical protein
MEKVRPTVSCDQTKMTDLPPLETVDQVIEALKAIETTIEFQAMTAKLHLSKHQNVLRCSLQKSTNLMKKMEVMQHTNEALLKDIIASTAPKPSAT